MKTPLIRPILAALITCSIQAAPPEKAPEKPAAAEKPKAAADEVDLAKFKTADEFWDYIVKVGSEKPPSAKSREEFVQILQSWLERQRSAAEAFLKRFPEDTHRWDAKVVALLTSMQLQQFGGKPVDTVAGLKDVEAISAAPDAAPETKSEAAYLSVQLLAQTADTEKPETMAPLQKAVTAFLDAYPESKRAQEIAGMQMSLLSLGNPPNADAILKKLSASKNEAIAAMAKSEIEKKEKMANLKTKPMDLTFTATDGKEFDIAKLRGKVVLIDFWASWCGPCIGEMPNVVATYKKLHGKGFEIVGISLDKEKEAMEAALKAQGMTWTQYFDGQGWQNKISTSFGIDSIPAAWLLDKKGMLRETDLRGEALGTSVEKLLAE
jgi:thiol-disulfide isomerase/thioredoxin